MEPVFLGYEDPNAEPHADDKELEGLLSPSEIKLQPWVEKAQDRIELERAQVSQTERTEDKAGSEDWSESGTGRKLELKRRNGWCLNDSSPELHWRRSVLNQQGDGWLRPLCLF